MNQPDISMVKSYSSVGVMVDTNLRKRKRY